MLNSKLLIFSIVLAISTVFSSAIAQNTYTPIKQIYCEQKPTEFHLFYDGETLPFEYEKLGEVSCRGQYNGIHDRYLLNDLKYLAWQNCANGLVFIKTGYIGQEGQKYYTAVAVRIKTDSQFREKHGSGSDMSFVKYAKIKEAQLQKQRNAGGGLILVGVLMLIYLLTQLEY